MNRKATTTADIGSRRIVIAALCLAAVFWGVDAAFDALVFGQGTLTEQLLHPGSHETWTRAVVGGVIAALGLHGQREINRRDAAESAMRKSEQRYRDLFDNASDLIQSVNASGGFEYVNRKWLETLGYSQEEVKGLNLMHIVREDQITHCFGLFERVLRGEAFDNVETVFVSKSGREIYVQGNINARIADGEFVATRAIFRDITESKRMEQQLLLNNRLASVGELAAGVAHELNNPLAAVQGYSEYLATMENLDEAIRRDVEVIYKEAQRASRITANLLGFAHRHEPDRIPTSINEVVEQSLELHTRHMEVNGIEVITEFSDDLPETMADPHQLLQVFMNIIANAEQAMTGANGRGRLTVQTRRVGDMIDIEFGDDGPGIREDYLPRIFDPFFTTKEVGEGTGLGLSICHGIVERHGGRIQARSDPDQGTTVVVEIPIVPREEDQKSHEIKQHAEA